MDPPQELSLSEIRKYMLANGCCVTNHALVKHFKCFLTHPETQNEKRKQFKMYVNILATIKNENNQKYLILRKKYKNECPGEEVSAQVTLNCNDSSMSSAESKSSSSSETPSLSSLQRKPPPYKPPPKVAASNSPLISQKQCKTSVTMMSGNPIEEQNLDNHRECTNEVSTLAYKSDPKNGIFREQNTDEKDEKLVNKENTGDNIKIDAKLSCPIDDAGSLESPISVKEATRKFNRLASEEEAKILTSPNKRKVEKLPVQVKMLPEVTMTHPKAKEWVVAMAKTNYQELAKLLHDNPELVKLQDPATSYTALHWAAKHGNEDVVKLIAGTYKADVNARTNGGYTPLHIAMQLGRANIFALLCNTYKANRDLLDWAGNKPLDYSKQQTSVSASTYSKIKAKRKPFLVDKDTGFLRIGSLNVRVKKTTEAFSNFLGVGNVGGQGATTNHHPRGQRHHHYSMHSNDDIMRNHGRRETVIKKSATFAKSNNLLGRATATNSSIKHDTMLHKSWSSADNIPQRNIPYSTNRSENSVTMLMPPPSKVFDTNVKRRPKHLKHPLEIGTSTAADFLRESISSPVSTNFQTLGYSSMPTTPNHFRSSLHMENSGIDITANSVIDSDSDSAYGFDSTWSIDNVNTSNGTSNNNNKY